MRALASVISTFLICATIVLPLAAQSPEQGRDYETDIRQLRKELRGIQEERKNNRLSAQNDRNEFAVYRERAGNRAQSLKKETDSLHTLISVASHRRDSLGILISAESNTQKELVLRNAQFRALLRTSCDSLEALIINTPPLIISSLRASLALLRSDLSGTSIDNMEGSARIHQLLQQIEEASASIVVQEEASPCPEVAGLVYRLRIGTFFEAVVDLKGEHAALWRGNTKEGVPQWALITEQEVTAQIHKAAIIREGKMLPALIDLPLARGTTGRGAR